MTGEEITTGLDNDSLAILRAYASQEQISIEYAASILLTREINAIAASSLAPRRPSAPRAVE